MPYNLQPMSPFRRRTNGLRRERIQASPRFSDGTFRNTTGVGPSLKKGSTVPVMREFMFGGGRRVPIAPLPSVSPLGVWAKPADTGLRATWLGHSTLLLEIDGVRVLTDPVWSRRVSPSTLFGPKRFQPVPVPISKLPALDAVIISHDHYDHLDYASIVELIRHDVPFYTALGVGAHLEAWGVRPERITELDWWESAELPNAGLPHHRGAVATLLGARSSGSQSHSLVVVRVAWPAPWCVLQWRHRPHARVRRDRTAARSLRPRHARGRRLPSRLGTTFTSAPTTPSQALKLLGGGSFLPVHWGTFDLAIHDWDEPAERLIELAPSLDTHSTNAHVGRADRAIPGGR